MELNVKELRIKYNNIITEKFRLLDVVESLNNRPRSGKTIEQINLFNSEINLLTNKAIEIDLKIFNNSKPIVKAEKQLNEFNNLDLQWSRI